MRASEVVDNLGVKRHLFNPSGRVLLTVLGKEGDFLVDISDSNINGSYFCSCDDFHFRVMNGEVKECYHLIAARRALQQKKFKTIEFSDEEYKDFLHALVNDLFSNIH